MPTDQVHLWLDILGKCTEIDQCLHIIKKTGGNEERKRA